MTFPGIDYGEPWRTVGTLSPTVEIHSSERWEQGLPPFVGNIWRTTDAARIVACINALAGLDPAKLAALLDSADEALAHILELEAAWRRGAISEHDGKGGTRSNRNFALRFKLESALAELRGAAS